MIIHAIALLAALVVHTQDKVDIKDTTVGSGREAQANDVLTVEYVGTVQGGKEFDSSKGKQPLSFVLGGGQVIRGWDQGLAGMKVGGKRHLVIPASLAYGDQAMGEAIPANSTLVFDIELLRIDRTGDPAKIELATVTPGKGDAAKAGDEVVVNWRGSFINGKEFINSYTSKQPAKLACGSPGLPKGINQAIEGIKAGEKRHAVVPYTLGFGANGAQGIPPYATLVLDVEAVSVTPRAEAIARDIKMLKIEEVTPGTGAEAKDGDTVEVHYTGMFPDGKKFDSSLDRNQTFKVKVGAGQVIRGFDLGILGMKVGGKRKVSIPADLGYGARGAGNTIPPNQDLVFEIELVSVK
jgi:FKBP-type peptidyl-prolyl cis-trans isomerase